MDINRKVLAYITNGEEPNLELLVFRQERDGEQDFRVPGGTIEKDELIIDALYRKIQEETGLKKEQLEFLGKVNKTNFFPEDREKVYERTIFHLSFIGDPPKTWEHRVTGDNTYKNSTFYLRFIPIKKLPDLASNQGQSIPLMM